MDEYRTLAMDRLSLDNHSYPADNFGDSLPPEDLQTREPSPAPTPKNDKPRRKESYSIEPSESKYKSGPITN